MKQDDKTQLWIAVGNHPGTGAWFSVWVVSRFTRVRSPQTATRKLPRGACTA